MVKVLVSNQVPMVNLEAKVICFQLLAVGLSSSKMESLFWSYHTDEMERELRGFLFLRRPSGLQLALRPTNKKSRLSAVCQKIKLFKSGDKFSSDSNEYFLNLDDNSSIQSSPWQRDHCWKQARPRRCTTLEFNFYYRRDPRTQISAPVNLLVRKYRRPLDPTPLQLIAEPNATHKKTTHKIRNNAATGKTLSLIIDKLSRLDPNVVSPRKRILRELERVTLEDQASKRRATPQPITLSTTIIPTTTSTTIPSPKHLSSYSITSILGENKPNPESGFLRNLLKLDDGHAFNYLTSNFHPRTRVDPFIGSANTSVHHPFYGVPVLPPGTYRAPGLWMHYPPPVHYSPRIHPTYLPPPIHPSSPPVHHYKEYREQTLTPPSGR